MNNLNQIKTILVVVGLLFLGFAGGFFTHKYVVTQHLERIASWRAAEGFQAHLLEMLAVTDEQRALIAPILAETGTKMDSIHHQSRRKRRQAMEEMRADLKIHLTPEQVQKMEAFGKRFRSKPPYRKKRGRGQNVSQRH